jgi:hypothetical protein
VASCYGRAHFRSTTSVKLIGQTFVVSIFFEPLEPILCDIGDSGARD